MHDFTRSLITEWRKLKLPVASKTFVVAISGGADSVSLMLALNELKERGKLDLRFVAAHFNHDLRGADSEQDLEFVRGLTMKFNFEFVSRTQSSKSKIENQTGNLEQNARQARYDFLTETAENLDADGVLTAHTLNDQAETFLLNLIRGSGLDGLGGMRVIRPLDAETRGRGNTEIYNSNSNFLSASPHLRVSASPLLVRPLLNWAKREDTENFCLLNKIEFRHDAMNDDLAFKRVRIRKILLPMLKEFNPKIVETLAKTSELLRESAECLAIGNQKSALEGREEKSADGGHLAEDQIPKSKDQTENLLLKDLKDVFPSIRRLVLRDWLKNNRGNLRRLELKHIEAIEKLMFSRKSGRIVELPNGEKILKKDGKLIFQKTKVEKN